MSHNIRPTDQKITGPLIKVGLQRPIPVTTSAQTPDISASHTPGGNIIPGPHHFFHSLSTGAFRQDLDILSVTLDNVIKEQCGEKVLSKIHHLKQLAQEARLADSPEKRNSKKAKLFNAVAVLDIQTARSIIRGLTIGFYLRNQAEQLEIIRINRQRQEVSHTSGMPRKESIAHAIYTLKQRGASACEVQEYLNELSVEPVFTAHPTETKRREIIENLISTSCSLTVLERYHQLPEEARRELSQIRENTGLLWTAELIRPEKPTVDDESINTIPYILNTAFDTIPKTYADLRMSLQTYYPSHQFIIRPLVHYSSWVGGDRDGNPNVTPDLTLQIARRHAICVLNKYIEILSSAKEHLISAKTTPRLERALAKFKSENLGIDLHEKYPIGPNEHYRQMIAHIQKKLILTLQSISENKEINGKYKDHKEFVAHLELLEKSLQKHHLYSQVISDLIIQAKTFGFHLAQIDVREHSERHLAAVSELLSKNLKSDIPYDQMKEKDRVAVLSHLLCYPGKISPNRDNLSEQTRTILETFDAIKSTQGQISKESIKNYLISFTQSVSDILEVLVLAKEAGLIQIMRDRHRELKEVKGSINVVPLFETGDDLDHASGIMGELYGNKFYRAYLKSRTDYQQIMLGYSDGTKDSGFLEANIAILDAQIKLAKISRQFGINWEFFHGRGGSLGRGGGEAGKAILSLPPGTMNHKVRVTEQGEVLSLRYSLPEMAHRHTECLVSAALLAEKPEQEDPIYHPKTWALIRSIAKKAKEKYRTLVYPDTGDSNVYWEILQQSTPLRFIRDLRCGSRPSKRTGKQTLEDLRAIPFVMSHNQQRSCIPAWYGVGTALQELHDNNGLDTFSELLNQSDCLRTLLYNCQLGLTRADGLYMAQHYYELAQPQDTQETIFQTAQDEYNLAMSHIMSLTNGTGLLSPVILQSVRERNPETDVLNCIQVTLLKKLYGIETPNPDEKMAVLESMNGIVAALFESG